MVMVSTCQRPKQRRQRDKETDQDMMELRHRVAELPCVQQAAHDAELQLSVLCTLGFCRLVPEPWPWL